MFTTILGTRTYGLRPYLQELESELSAPIRLLAGRGRRVAADSDWTPDQAAACDVSVEYANEHGITLWSWGMPHGDNAEPLRTTYGYAEGIVSGVNEDDDDTFRHYFGDLFRIEDAEAALFETDYEIVTVSLDSDGGTTASIIAVGDRVSRNVGLCYPIEYLDDYMAPANYAGHPQVNFDMLIGDLLRGMQGEIDPALLAEREQRQVDQLIVHARTRNSAAVGRLQTSIANTERDLAYAQSSIPQHVASLRTQQKELDSVLTTLSEGTVDGDLIQRQWEALKNHPKLKSVKLGASTLTFDTEHLTLHDPIGGREAPLGEFRVRVGLGPNTRGESATFKMTNLTNARGGRDHPHIPGGQPCFGELNRTMLQFAASYEIHPLVEFCLTTLESVNINDDWGRYASYWFEDSEHRDLLVQHATATVDPPLPTGIVMP